MAAKSPDLVVTVRGCFAPVLGSCQKPHSARTSPDVGSNNGPFQSDAQLSRFSLPDGEWSINLDEVDSRQWAALDPLVEFGSRPLAFVATTFVELVDERGEQLAPF
jgi:hypothetical protein